MADEPTGSDLEQRMRGDETGATRDAIQRSLQDEAARLKRTMDSGVAPAQFAGLHRRHAGDAKQSPKVR